MDKIKIGSLVTNLILFIIVLVLLRFVGCEHGKSQPCAEVSRSTDTVTRYVQRTDTLYKTLASYVPKPAERRSGKQEISDQVAFPDFPVSRCTDTLLYSDSIYRANEFKAVIADIITGNRIAQRTVQWADLTPMEVKTVTNTITVEKKQALVKVYLGADAGVRYAMPYTNGGLDIGPSGSVVFADRYMIDAGYYILGGEFTAGVKVKLSFRK